MKKFIKQLRILIAIPIRGLAEFIDDRDYHDIQADFDRLNPSPDKATSNIKKDEKLKI